MLAFDFLRFFAWVIFTALMTVINGMTVWESKFLKLFTYICVLIGILGLLIVLFFNLGMMFGVGKW
jgi:hypothetical protein